MGDGPVKNNMVKKADYLELCKIPITLHHLLCSLELLGVVVQFHLEAQSVPSYSLTSFVGSGSRDSDQALHLFNLDSHFHPMWHFNLKMDTAHFQSYCSMLDESWLSSC